MTNNLKRDAQLLHENEAWRRIMDELESDLITGFRSTPDEELIHLKRKIEALDVLRGEIQSRLVHLLETA